jgi:hypothetical protein
MLWEYSDDQNFGGPPAAYYAMFIFLNFKNIESQEVACLNIFLVLLSSTAATENAKEAKVRTHLQWDSVLFMWSAPKRRKGTLILGPRRTDKAKHFYNHVLMAKKCKTRTFYFSSSPDNKAFTVLYQQCEMVLLQPFTSRRVKNLNLAIKTPVHLH